jgi:NifU-like protein involved in Fe-S cluster formation
LIEKIIGQNIAEVRKIDQKKLLVFGFEFEYKSHCCATLTLKALQEALDRYEQKSN